MPDLVDYERYEAIKLERDRLRSELAELREENRQLKLIVRRRSGVLVRSPQPRTKAD
jgi:hypothetical protein